MNDRRKSQLILFVATIFLTSVSPSLSLQQETDSPAQQEDDVVRVTTSLVTIPVSVMDRNGRFVSGLEQNQFHLFEDGIEQHIAFFDGAEQAFTVALMLDVSDSTKEKLDEIKNAARAFIDELKENDRVMVVVFDKNITVMCEPTSDRTLVNLAIDRARWGGGTSLYDAVELMATKQLRRIRGRKAIVLFTDGVDTTSSGATYEGTLRAAEELDALIYSIQYNTYDVETPPLPDGQPAAPVVTSTGEPLSVAYKRAGVYLQSLSDKTAGRFYSATGLKYLRQIFSRIAAELRQQYSLGYYPSNKSAAKRRRDLKVRVNLPGVALRYRRSYIYAAQ
ncbi:MAG TPA: VWA domain-containing protein [Pyrinomonadaceae bacterium]|nr:VWA domain-containing protein [Pyrinomonadaceae bacterium]